MRDFLKDTKDSYEICYGKDICKNFPRYGEFWSKYIGQRKDNLLKHYEIDSSKTGISKFDEKYERMTFAHYGVFIDLTGVRIDINRLSLNKYKTKQDVFEFWNDVRNAYSKMGDSIYKYGRFLDCVRGVLNIGKAVDPILKKLKDDLEDVKSKRDFMVHFTALPFIHDELGSIKKIPRDICDANGKELPYGQILRQPRAQWIEVESKICSDLAETESKFNDGHEKIIIFFEKHGKFVIIDPGPRKDAAIAEQSFSSFSSSSPTITSSSTTTK